MLADVFNTLTQPGSGTSPRMGRGAVASDTVPDADQGPSFRSLLAATTARVEVRPITKSADIGETKVEIEMDADDGSIDLDWFSKAIGAAPPSPDLDTEAVENGSQMVGMGLTAPALMTEMPRNPDGSGADTAIATTAAITEHGAGSVETRAILGRQVSGGTSSGTQTSNAGPAALLATTGIPFSVFGMFAESVSSEDVGGAESPVEAGPGSVRVTSVAANVVPPTAWIGTEGSHSSDISSRDLPTDAASGLRSGQSVHTAAPEAAVLAQGFAVDTARATPTGTLPLALPQLRDGISEEVRAMADRARTEVTTSRHAHGGLTTELELAPAELGRLRLVLQTGERGLHLSVLVDRPESIELVRRHLDGLHRSLLGEGIRLDGVDISTGDREQGAGDRLRQQMGADQQPDLDSRIDRDTPPRRAHPGERNPSEDGPQPRDRPSFVQGPGPGRLDIRL